VLSYVISHGRLELTATGSVTPTETAKTLNEIRDNPSAPDGMMLLLDVRQHDAASIDIDEIPGRLAALIGLLGPKLGVFWAIVIEDHVEQVIKGRLVQSLAQGHDVTVLLFSEVVAARDWLNAMAERTSRRTGLSA
jgi:hypothetical protein